MEYVVGIDPSLTNSGLCLFYRNGTHAVHRIGSKPAAGLAARFDRYNSLVEQIIEVMPVLYPTCICIEGYSFGSKGQMQIDRYEFGGLLRHRLLSLFGRDSKVVEVPPTSLKLFASGRGNADKTAMRMAVFKRWSFEAADDDTCDAYALAKLATVLAGWQECDNAEQRRAMAGVLGEKIKKPKRKEVA